MKVERPTRPPVPGGIAGLEILRSLIKQRSILAGLQAMHTHLGDVFQITLPGFSPVVLVGPEANRFVLVSERDKFLWRNEKDPVTRLLRHGLLVEDHERHACLRERMEPLLYRRNALTQVEGMNHYTDQILDSWGDGEQRDMLVEMRRVALLILMGTMFKVDFLNDMARLWRPILRSIDFISPGGWIVWPGMPRFGYKRPLQELDDYLYHIIRARRQDVGEADDLLGALVSTPGMDDDLIRDQLLTMLIAGHDTSTALLAWALYLLGRHPQIMTRAQVEVDAVFGKNPPQEANLSELRLLDWVIKEALRLYPPIHVGNRLAATDLQVQGYDIAAGQRIMYSIYLSHRHPEHWHQAPCFQPQRFDRRETRKRPPLTYVPFGGGPRNCIGAGFALIEARVVLARILQRFELKLAPAKVHPHMGATLEPRPGVMMFVRRRR